MGIKRILNILTYKVEYQQFVTRGTQIIQVVYPSYPWIFLYTGEDDLT